MAERVQLQVTLDSLPVTNGARRMEQDFSGSVDRMNSKSEGLGRSMQNAARMGGQAMTAMSAGIGAATAAAAASERSFLSLGTAILASFAAGGPVAGGIALAAGAIGLLASGTSEAEAAAKKADEAYQTWLGKVKGEADAARSALEKLSLANRAVLLGVPTDELGLMEAIEENEKALVRIAREAAGRIGLIGADPYSAKDHAAIDEINEALERQRALLDEIRRTRLANMAAAENEARSAYLGKLGTGNLINDDTSQWGDVTSEAYQAYLDSMEKGRVEQERQAAARQELVKSVRDEVDELQAANEYRREMVQIEQRIRDLREKGVPEADLATLRGELVGGANARESERRAAAEAKAQREAQQQAKAHEKAQQQAMREMAARGPTMAQQLLDSFGPTLSAGLTDFIMDGIETGFENGADIATRLVNTLISQLLNQSISLGLNALFGAIGGGFGGGGGGGFGSVLSSVVGVGSGFAGAGGGGFGGGAPAALPEPDC